MQFSLQPTHLQNEFVQLLPLEAADFERLFKVAADPLIWEQHPNKNRYQLTDFKNYFEGAVISGGAFIVLDAVTQEPIGSSRFCNYSEENSTIEIGYTFLARDHWGSTYNKALKTLMLNHAFNFVSYVQFFIGENNIRSQKSIVRLGATKVGEAEVEYYGEPMKKNFIYQIDKEYWMANQVQ
jgi:RimJ/RimL family protein N-acetyltransferase